MGHKSITLTARELEVLAYTALGHTVKEISAIIGCSIKTAEAHKFNLMKKTKVTTSVGLTHLAIRHGVVELLDDCFDRLSEGETLEQHVRRLKYQHEAH
jgi:DNA-binding CsgD family transcriptional regulator